MGRGDPKSVARWTAWLLLVLAWAALAAPPRLTLSRLAADPAPARVLDGGLSGQFRVQPGQTLYEQGKRPVWWRITADAAIPATGEPQLVLESPFLNRIQAWVPGRSTPGRYSLYGRAADPRYSSRALVIGLPHGLPAGEAIWLRLTSPAAAPMVLSIQPRDAVHRADLRYVAWRSAILATLIVLALLATAFWVGMGERSYGFFAGNLFFAAVYLMAMGGEGRDIPVIGDWFGGSAQAQRFFACLGVIFSNGFQRLYLDLPRRLPWLDRILLATTAMLSVLALVSLVSDTGLMPLLGNICLLVSALVVIVASAILSWRGDRPARILLLSWLPLIVLVTLRTTELMGWWIGPEWLGHALAASFALAGLLLTVGLADKLLELRRDRDRASAQANVDALTSSLSRTAIERRLREEVAIAHRAGRKLCIAFIDIDHFKRVNDSHGHPIGDQCLRFISQRVRNRLRTQDVLGRYGGDELLVVMPDTTLAEAIDQSERLRATINCRPLSIDGLLLDASLSLGVAELRANESVADLLARADAALYAGKASGRDRVSFDDSLSAQARA